MSTNTADIDQIIAYENDELDPRQILTLFGSLIASGMVWSLQGTYGRGAQAMLDQGLLSAGGEITAYAEERLDYFDESDEF